MFALALAIQVLVWGTAQPFVGAIADRFGSLRVLSAGALLYCAGLTLMAYSTTPGMLDLTAGRADRSRHRRLSFTIVIAAFGKLMPPQWRTLAFGARHRRRLVRPVSVFAAGSRLHRLVRLAARADRVRLHHAAGDPAWRSRCARAPMDMTVRPGAVQQQSLLQALAEAFGHRSLRAAGARLLHLRFPACCSSPCICRLIWSTADCRSIPAPGRSAPSACSTSSARSRPAGSATACRSAICCRSFIAALAGGASCSSCCR